MDISDILAEATSNVPSRPQELSDHIELTRAWINEKNAPEILIHPGPLMARVLDRLRAQVSIL